METLKSAEGEKVTCDTIVEKLCKVYRATGSWKGIIGNPSETELADPGYFVDKTCHCCKDKVHLKNDFPKVAQK